MGARRYLQVILLGFLGGIFSESYFALSIWPVFLILAAGVMASFLVSRQVGVLFVLFGIFFSGGTLLFQKEKVFWSSLPNELVFQGTAEVVGLEETRVFYRPVTLAPIQCEGSCPEVRILYRAPLTFEAKPGDIFSFACALTRPENFDPHFDYQNFLATRGTGYVCERDGVATFLESPSYSLRRSLFELRESVAAKIRHALPEPTAGLALGLVLGGNDFLGREIKDMFARTGLSHIVAVSGYNMTILVQFTLVAGLLIGLWRRQALVVSAILIFFFLLLIGAPASALRAALMTAAGFLAFFFGRLPASYNALLLAGALMLLPNPLLMRFDVGFQLSFLATLALLVGSPFIEQFLPLKKWWGKGSALLLFTFIIELFTLPVLFTTFGQATWLAPVTNLLILPLVPIAMLLTIFLLPFSFLFSSLSPFLALPLWGILALQVWIAEFFSELPFGLILFRDLGMMGTVLWYLGLLVLIAGFRFYRKKYVLGMAQ